MTARPRTPRQLRERDIVRGTRALFDERGLQDAPVEEIARSVGIARGLIYRYFSSKEELYIATMLDYLEELHGVMTEAVDMARDPAARLERLTRAFIGFCERYPAFLDSSLALMKRPAAQLRDNVSPSVWINLGQGMADCLEILATTLRDGSEAEVFAVTDPDAMANLLWAQMLGLMHLARIKVGVRRTPEGNAALFRIDLDDLEEACLQSAMAVVRGGVSFGPGVAPARV
ncbi:MAG: TetR family transcriptional regulator [Solirubrobacterales bacterium]|nr:TetR family transcriptional regulator [Solirubrobacterales bacterium]